MTTKDEENNLHPLMTTLKVTKTKVKGVRSAGVKPVTEKKSREIEGAPFSAKSFSELGLPSLLIERLEREGFTVPTDVQSSAIPTILENHDIVIQSYTGSGKTLAYLLPILAGVGPLNEVRNADISRKKMDIEAVIVAPSRELGMQIVREVEKLLGPDDKKLVQQLVGGANRSRQEEALRKNKPIIIVGTPGRLAEISAAGKLHTHDCRYLVLDEVVELLSFNFREDMHRILEHVGKRSGSGRNDFKIPTARKAGRQTIMVSATVPFSVVRAARSWGCDPLLVQAKKVLSLDSVTPSGPVNLTGTSSGSTSSSTSNTQTSSGVQSLPPALKQYYCVTRLQHKIDTLRICVHALDAKSVIAFMNHTRQLKDAVYKLEARGMNAIELHGDLGKLARSTILKKFKSGEVRVLVTNELSARGLDVPECDLVVNLDLPTDSIHYAHRAGRTGRLGRKGSMVTICEEREVFVITKMQKQLAVPIQSCDFAEGKLLVTEDEKTTDTGRCALVTGGNKGIGLETCRKLAENGITVILTARNEKNGTEAVEKLKLSGLSDVVFHQLDIKDPASISAVAKFVRTSFGKLDVLVNNAAAPGMVIAKPEELRSFKEGAAFAEVSDEYADLLEGILVQDYKLAEECLETNYYGVKAVITELLPLLQLSSSARIVNVTSNYGELQFIHNEEVKAELANVENLSEEKIDDIVKWFLKDFKEDKLKANGWPLTVSAYKISKASIAAYTRLLARDFPHMKINCVHPGYVQTDITSKTGPLTPEEGARAPAMVALLPDDGPSGIYFSEMQPSSF